LLVANEEQRRARRFLTFGGQRSASR